MTITPGATDADLLARYAQGDDVAFTEPGVRYLPMIHANIKWIGATAIITSVAWTDDG